MKNMIVCLVLILLTEFMSGCEKIGYMVIVSTKQVRYDDLQQIGGMLEDRGFKKVAWERKNDLPKFPGEVYTLFQKNLGGKPYHRVDVCLTFGKDASNNIAHNLMVYVENIYEGMTVTELKDEIDKIGDLVYQELVGKVGKENVLIQRKGMDHRVIVF